jgi:hypothetical protein
MRIRYSIRMKPHPSLVALISIALVGCAIKQNVRPVERLEGKEVCIVENLAVKQAGFLATYQRVLTEKGYVVRVMPAASAVTVCPVTSTYTANWRWDLALYLAYADITVYSNGQQSGQAIYDSLRGGFNLGKFVHGETKIVELVNQLFPGTAKP